jgi:hypothetical protein
MRPGGISVDDTLVSVFLASTVVPQSRVTPRQRTGSACNGVAHWSVAMRTVDSERRLTDRYHRAIGRHWRGRQILSRRAACARRHIVIDLDSIRS